MARPENIDAAIADADWIKMSWPFDTVDEFIGALGVRYEPKENQREAVERFMNLPLAEHMPRGVYTVLRRRGLL